MKSIIVIAMLFFAGTGSGYAQYVPQEKKPHLEIKCPCGANFALYEWVNNETPEMVSSFLEKHPCGHNLVIGARTDRKVSITRLAGTNAYWLLVQELPIGVGKNE